jgi:hypothetical protein
MEIGDLDVHRRPLEGDRQVPCIITSLDGTDEPMKWRRRNVVWGCQGGSSIIGQSFDGIVKCTVWHDRGQSGFCGAQDAEVPGKRVAGDIWK